MSLGRVVLTRLRCLPRTVVELALFILYSLFARCVSPDGVHMSADSGYSNNKLRAHRLKSRGSWLMACLLVKG
jgi:hypothetical protein